jgi:hypothetical protein
MLRSLVVLSLLAIVVSPAAFGQTSDSISVTRSAQIPRAHPGAGPACSPDHRTDPKAGVLVSEVILEGTTVGSGELSTIKSQIEGACFDEQSDVMEEVIQAAFSDLGFAQASVENVTLKASDTLAVPKPVTVKADITEGPRFRVGAIRFTGDHAFSEAKLRAAFPIKKGDLFQRSKIASGLNGIRKLYGPKGYYDLVFVPDVLFSSTGTVDLRVTLFEGPQYHMGDLKIYAKKEVADRLAGEWHLREGAIFDANYPQTFIEESHSLPPEFGRQNIAVVRNCPESSIAVLLIVDQTDPGLQTPPKEVRCKKTDDSE